MTAPRTLATEPRPLGVHWFDECAEPRAEPVWRCAQCGALLEPGENIVCFAPCVTPALQPEVSP